MKKIILLFTFSLISFIFAPFERAPLRAEKPITKTLAFREVLASTSPSTFCCIYDQSTGKLNQKGTFSESETLALFYQYPRCNSVPNFKNDKNLLIVSEVEKMPLKKLLKNIWESLPS